MQEMNHEWTEDVVCARDYYALLREFGHAQQRVTQVLSEKMALIADLQQELARLNAQPQVLPPTKLGASAVQLDNTANASWYLAAV